MGHQQAIDRLERGIKQLKIDYDRFFNGAIHTPPEEQRRKIQEQLRLLRSATLLSAVDRFRLNTLEARLNSFDELFRRRLREREQSPPVVVPEADGRAASAGQGYLVDGPLTEETVSALYRELSRGGAAGAGGSDLATFRSYLSDQVDRIKARTRCTKIRLRVASDHGKLKLKAKPIKES